MVNGGRFSKNARTLAESSSSCGTSSASRSSSTGDTDKMDGIRNERSNEYNRFAGGVKRGDVANEFSYSSSQFPRLPAAVPLLTEKQQQLLLRYLCVSNDEASRMLMQAAARQHIYPGLGEEKTAVALGGRTISASSGNPGAAAVCPPVSHDGGLSTGASGPEERSFSSGRRAAARASSSSPVSPFAAATSNTFNDSSAAAPAVKYSVPTVTRLLQEEPSYAANYEKELSCQPQPISRLHPQVLRVEALNRPELKHKESEELHRQQKVMPRQQLETRHAQPQELNLRNTADGSVLTEAGKAGDPAATQVVYPLRPCLRRRSNVRFRSPIAEDSEQQSHDNNSAPVRASARAHAAPAETHNSTTGVAPDASGSSTCTSRKNTSSSSCRRNSCCFSFCHNGYASSSLPPRPSLLRVPSDHSSDIPYGTGHSGHPTNPDAPGFVHCCFRCPASAACAARTSLVPGVQCSCCSQFLCRDRQAAAQAPAEGTADAHAADAPTVLAQASLPPATPRSCVHRRYQCDGGTAVEDRSCCCRVASCSSGRREEFWSCCCACCKLSLYSDETSSTSSHDEQEEKPLCFTSSSLRRRIPRSLVSAVPPPPDQTHTFAPKEAAATGAAAAARGPRTTAQMYVSGEGGNAQAPAQLENAMACQLFCRYPPCHEEEGPRPCCGPGSSDKDMLMQQQRAHEKHDENVCCCCCRRRLPASDPQKAPTPRSTSGQDNMRTCFTCSSGRLPATIPEPLSVPDAGFPSQTVVDAMQAAASAQPEDAIGALEVKNTTLQCFNCNRHYYCIQEQQQDRLPRCCSRRAGRVPQAARKQRYCLHPDLHFSASSTAAAGEGVSCCAASRSLFSEGQSTFAPPSFMLDTTKRSTQQSVLRCGQLHVQEGQGLGQRYQMEQRQRPFTKRQPPRSSIQLQQSPEAEQRRQTYLRPTAASTDQADEFQKQEQQQLCIHRKGGAADSQQRHCVYFRPAGAAVTILSTRASLPTSVGTHTPSTAATLSSVAPSATPSCTSTPVRSGESGEALVNIGDRDLSSRLRDASLRLPAGRTPATRTSAATISAGTPAVEVVAPLQTVAPQLEVDTQSLRTIQSSAVETSVPAGLPSDCPRTTMVLEGCPWKFDAEIPKKQPLAGKPEVVADSKSLPRIEYSSFLQDVPAGSGAASGVNTSDWAGDFSPWPELRRGQGTSATPPTQHACTLGVAEVSAGTISTSPAKGHGVAGLAAIPAATHVGNSTEAPPANGTAACCDVRTNDGQVGEDLQQLLQRQQEELAEQLRRLDALEKRQQDLKQPQLRRRQDWWQRLRALEQQLQKQKATLEQHQRQRGPEARQMREQGSSMQQTLQSSREHLHTYGSRLSCSIACGPQQQQLLQIDGQPQSAAKGVPQVQLRQRRGSRIHSADEEQKTKVDDGLGIVQVFSAESCAQFRASRICSPKTSKDPLPPINNAAPASLVVLSRSTRKFQTPLLAQQQQQRQHRLHQQRQQEEEGRHQQQGTASQRQHRHPVGTSEKWLSQPKGKPVTRSGVVAWREDSCADSRRSCKPFFTVESEQLLLDEDDEEQELLELQEISEALEDAQFE